MEGLLDAEGRITDPYRNFIHISRYARWREDDNRRETWYETVKRYMDFMTGHLKENFNYTPSVADTNLVHSYILNHKAFPSMRALMTAGPALANNHIAAYNCSYLPIDDFESYNEALYILMHGTGVGFSAESVYVEQLPQVPTHLTETSSYRVIVEDSKEGWKKAVQEFIEQLYIGRICPVDTSLVRPAGARLKTFGGRASGPEPLIRLFDFLSTTFKNAAGRQLTDIEAHDIVCMIAEIVVVGGVRRSALISLGDLNSDAHRHAKSGEWWNETGYRRIANNSAVYEGKPSRETFNREWQALIASGSGERGIFNREASRIQASKNGRRKTEGIDFGTNPCSEIILRPYQFCNLTTVVVDGNDDFMALNQKVVAATILGTWQASLTNFKGLREIWKKNTEEEALLGVSMTGALGNALLNGKLGMGKTETTLKQLKETAIGVNARVADEIGINRAAAITCVKPEGTTSQFSLTSSGLHPWYSEYYLRSVRNDNKDPMTQFLKDSGFAHEPDVMAPEDTTVFYFPIAAPQGALTRNDLTAIEHLELWLAYQRAWCEHKPSVTINVKPEEWAEVGEWVYEHFNEVSGISFMPFDDHIYAQAPYQEVTKEAYEEALARMPKNVNWSLLSLYETEDMTTSTQDLACVAGACEVIGSADVNVQPESMTAYAEMA